MSELPENIPIFILDSNESTSLFITHFTNHKDSSGITSSTSNDFATAVNSVALVGELKTPSLPPSVHIPSIIPSQSLLPSTDEVFKEIKDVAISSLHLFQGDMDLPPSSFHASLEEQWDEEEEPEEIETVLKVVPPAYHQYLDVFSKVKAEKLPPHRACDPHIKLEGILPPVEAHSQFQILKEAFTTAPILSHLNPSLPAIVEIDASDYALGAILSQTGYFTRCLVTLGGCVPREGVDFISKNPQKFHQVFKKNEIKESRFFSLQVEVFSDLVDQIQKAVWQDKDYKEILKQLARGESVSDYTLEPQAKMLLFNNRVVISRNHELQLDMLQKRHDSLLAGHPGQEKTLKLIKRWTDREGKLDSRTVSLYVSYHQDDWHTWLPLAEFAYNNAKYSSTKQSPFFTIYGRNKSFDSIHISQDTPSGKLSTKLQSVQQVVKEELEPEVKCFRNYADRNRAIPPDFQPGDKVWLAAKIIKTPRPTKKISERWLGPFEVLKKIGSHAYHLKLPQQWKSVHPVFHVSLLEPVKQSTIPNKHQLPAPPVIVEEQEECEVAQVLDSKLKRGTIWYLVEWKGFNEDPERTT
ncbi:hypothetical protein O181_041685 [Austropuccinia psidii MF-1]|uniref:Chromo domain-containing protein n=1 Tax=Austropuccinia psidii MF-1 TaxID=1389203 RepID=A0A9Q3HHD8_9BASI|nr:hypothetical protein [Austropuccinia psidii MF-1]